MQIPKPQKSVFSYNIEKNKSRFHPKSCCKHTQAEKYSSPYCSLINAQIESSHAYWRRLFTLYILPYCEKNGTCMYYVICDYHSYYVLRTVTRKLMHKSHTCLSHEDILFSKPLTHTVI